MKIKYFLIMLTFVFSMLPRSMQAQSSADRLYAQGVEYMKTLDVVSQLKAISYFTKARVAYDSSSKKRLCSQQINICNSIIKKLQTAEGKTRANKKLPMQSAKKSTHVNAKQAIDLGLSVLWAECNVGAESPWQVGGLYAWGDAKGTMQSFDTKDYVSGIKDICGSSYDIAHVTWGGYWRLPRIEEYEELMYACTWTWEERNGQTGYTVKGKNGNTIFLPAGGHREYDTVVDKDTWGDYWSGSNYNDSKGWAWSFGFNKEQKNTYHYFKSMGRCVRPVFDRTIK